MSNDDNAPRPDKNVIQNTAMTGGMNMAEQGGETHGMKPKPATTPAAGRPSPPQGAGGGSSSQPSDT